MGGSASPCGFIIDLLPLEATDTVSPSAVDSSPKVDVVPKISSEAFLRSLDRLKLRRARALISAAAPKISSSSTAARPLPTSFMGMVNVPLDSSRSDCSLKLLDRVDDVVRCPINLTSHLEIVETSYLPTVV